MVFNNLRYACSYHKCLKTFNFFWKQECGFIDQFSKTPAVLKVKMLIWQIFSLIHPWYVWYPFPLSFILLTYKSGAHFSYYSLLHSSAGRSADYVISTIFYIHAIFKVFACIRLDSGMNSKDTSWISCCNVWKFSLQLNANILHSLPPLA